MAFETQKSQEYCDDFLSRGGNIKKINEFSKEEIEKFDMLRDDEKVAVLELDKTNRVKALSLPSCYYPIFCRLYPCQRRILLGSYAEQAYKILLSLTEDFWVAIAGHTYKELKQFIQNIVQYEENNGEKFSDCSVPPNIQLSSSPL